MIKFEIRNRITGAVMFTAEIDCEESTPESFKKRLAVLWAIKRSADLTSADLTYADLRYANLRYANLTYANLRYANLTYANLRYANEKKSALVERFKGMASRSDGYQFLIFSSSDLGNIIRAGCRTFTLEEFRAHVAKAYPGSPKAEETIRILNYLEGCLNQQAW